MINSTDDLSMLLIIIINVFRDVVFSEPWHYLGSFTKKFTHPTDSPIQQTSSLPKPPAKSKFYLACVSGWVLFWSPDNSSNTREKITITWNIYLYRRSPFYSVFGPTPPHKAEICWFLCHGINTEHSALCLQEQYFIKLFSIWKFVARAINYPGLMRV